MKKKKLIKKILKEVKKQLEFDIVDQFEDFEIPSKSYDEITIKCHDKTNEVANSCKFKFKWFN